MLLDPLFVNSSIVNNCVCTDGKKELQSKKRHTREKKKSLWAKEKNEKNGKKRKKRKKKNIQNIKRAIWPNYIEHT